MRRINAPKSTIKHYKEIELSVDVVSLNDVPFLVSTPENIHCGTGVALPNMKCMSLELELKNVARSFAVISFQVIVICVDIQFKVLKHRNLFGVETNAASRDEHVPKIERRHRVIKERARCYCAMLPCNYFPRMMVTNLVKIIMFHINAFAWRKGVSQTLKPQ